mmetsp:Transcript_38506/g.96448  ORF Transcript_38506/g.96448 Transcript_38506/m.96448 type:complete len:201 (+) Transcript_38506:646-1248(+)
MLVREAFCRPELSRRARLVWSIGTRIVFTSLHTICTGTTVREISQPGGLLCVWQSLGRASSESGMWRSCHVGEAATFSFPNRNSCIESNDKPGQFNLQAHALAIRHIMDSRLSVLHTTVLPTPGVNPSLALSPHSLATTHRPWVPERKTVTRASQTTFLKTVPRSSPIIVGAVRDSRPHDWAPPRESLQPPTLVQAPEPP